MPIECRAMCFFFFTKFHTRHNKPQNIQTKHTKKYITYTPSLTRYFALLLLLYIIPVFTMLLLACIAVSVCVCESVCTLLFHCADLQCFFCIFYTLRICFLRLAWSNKMAHFALPCLFCAARVYVCMCVLLLIMLLSKLAAALIHTNNAKSIWRASQ